MSIYTVWKQFSLRSLRLLYQTHFHIENAENLESPECLQYESLENSFSLFHFAKAEQQLKTALTLSANNSIVLTYILLLLIDYYCFFHEVSEAKKYYIKLKKLQSCHSDELKQNIYFEATRQIRTAYYEKLLSVNDWRYTLEDSLMLHTNLLYSLHELPGHPSCILIGNIILSKKFLLSNLIDLDELLLPIVKEL